MSTEIVGIDWSMSSPAIATNTNIYGLTNTKQRVGIFGEGDYVQVGVYPKYNSQYERYQWLVDWAVSILNLHKPKAVYIENYSYGAKGNAIFQLAETTGLLKQAMWRMGLDVIPVSPSAIKKHATGKGNADKHAMVAAFERESGVPLRGLLHIKDGAKTLPAPSTDIADAYWVRQYGLCHQAS